MRCVIVVGYCNYPLANGTCMAGAAFNKIANTQTTLTQIVPQGYLESTVYKNVGKGTKRGCNGEITVTFLDNVGAPCVDKAGNTMKYYWKHTYYKATGWDTDQHWYQMKPDASTIDIGEGNDVDVPAGQGLWFKVEAGWNSDFNFGVSGEAMMDAGTVPLANGTTPIIIPVSKACTLLDVTPKGYLESTVYKNVGKGTKRGCNGEITVTFLDNAGAPCVDKAGNTMKYYWKHTYYKATGWDTDQHWYQMKPDASTIDINKDNAPEIKMGEGLWVKVEAGWNADFYIEGPGVDDSAAE